MLSKRSILPIFSKMKKSRLKKIPKNHLCAQLLFTVLAFSATAILSYFFMRNIIKDNLVRNAESVFSFAQVKIESNLLERKTALNGFSQTIRGMIIRGDDTGILQSYINDITDHMRPGWGHTPNVDSFYVYFETPPAGPVFISGSRWKPPPSYNPTKRIWYQMAVAAGGDIVETPPYVNYLTRDYVITYARCIFDDEGRRLGVVCHNIQVNDIGRDIVGIALDQGGYGMLISQDLTIIAHANNEFIGMNVYDPSIPISTFADDIVAGVDVIERPLINWKGEDTVVLARKLPNGWYLGLLTPEGPFHQSLKDVIIILGGLSALFAVILIVILIRIDAAKNRSDQESRHKSAFLANMSHEIRTPMNAIIGMTLIGKSSAVPERKNYCFMKIEDASNHLLGVINDILDMSKIEANKFELSPEEFNFEKMLQSVVNVVNFRVDEKKQKLMVHIDRAIPKTLIADNQRVAQVITNLLGNAVKFTPEHGSINLNTCFLGEKDGVCTIQIAVTDTGIGISPEQQEKLFQSFHQAESNTTRKFGGTGLGLAISKNIVEMMGGKIWIQSELGKGSTFAFTIQAMRSARKKQAPLSQDVNWNNVRIMAVDDDPDILAYFTEIMQEFGVYCDTATSGEQALALMEQNGHYHIFFVDWKMPGMDGIQLADELKVRAPTNSVIIMISAAEWRTVEDNAGKAGVDKFLPKPLFPSAIADAINEALGYDTRQVEETQMDIAGIFKGRRILLAEDVEINREIVIALLEPTLLEIDCAENGMEAVRMYLLSPEKYDMIFMDVQMPEMDGYDATRRIRELDVPGAEKIPIVAMTANVFREDVERCIEAGMNSHIGKPLDLGETLDMLRTYLS